MHGVFDGALSFSKSFRICCFQYIFRPRSISLQASMTLGTAMWTLGAPCTESLCYQHLCCEPISSSSSLPFAGAAPRY